MQRKHTNNRRRHRAGEPRRLNTPLVRTSLVSLSHHLYTSKTHKASRDVRSTPTPKATYSEVHSDDVTSLGFHPASPTLLISGSTDGLVSVHDTTIADEDELTVQTFNHNASIHDAAFLTPTEVFALSHDETFALYDVAEERTDGNATRDFGDLRKVLGCQYVANVTTKLDGSGAILGAGAQEYVYFSVIDVFET